MSPVVGPSARPEAPPWLSRLYAPIQGELGEVEQLLQREMRSKHPYVDKLVRYGCMLGGKRLRPALLLLAAKACGGIRREHIVLGAVVEMIHTATLVHDDVLDEADMRRHVPTVNARWDSEASILLGDFLFSHAFYLASTLDTTRACQIIGRATNVVCEGELRQKGSRGDYKLSEADYLSIVEAKTAELCACSCELGAIYAGADDATTRELSEYGRELGIAFQIVDDLLDLLGEENVTGKSLGSDFLQHKPTLPLIHAVQSADSLQEGLVEILHQVRGREQLLVYLEPAGSIEYTERKAKEFAGRARERLAVLPASDACEALAAIVDFVVSRRH